LCFESSDLFFSSTCKQVQFSILSSCRLSLYLTCLLMINYILLFAHWKIHYACLQLSLIQSNIDIGLWLHGEWEFRQNNLSVYWPTCLRIWTKKIRVLENVASEVLYLHEGWEFEFYSIKYFKLYFLVVVNVIWFCFLFTYKCSRLETLVGKLFLLTSLLLELL
jgi:hypothetical protein